jgi:dihydrofolate synthase/folylpolyglutamate synthase
VAAVRDVRGNPQRAMKVMHLTGTNGKTSASRMVEHLVASKPSLRTVEPRQYALDS